MEQRLIAQAFILALQGAMGLCVLAPVCGTYGHPLIDHPMKGHWSELTRRLTAVSVTALAMSLGLLALGGPGAWEGTPLNGLSGSPLLVHEIIEALALAGVFLCLYAGRLERRGELYAARYFVRRGGLTAAAAMALQFPVLLWLFSGMEPKVRAAFLGGDIPATVLSALAEVLMYSGAGIALLSGLAGKARPSCYLATLLMVAACIVCVVSIDLGLHP